MSRATSKIKVTSTVSSTWTQVPGTNATGSVEITSIQWSENDNSSTLGIREAIGQELGTTPVQTYTKTVDATTGDIITHTSTTAKAIEVFDPPRHAFLPLFYSDGGGGNNTFILKYKPL